MSPDEIHTKIEKKHRDKLEQFKQTVMNDANLVDGPNSPAALQPIRAGRFKSITNRFADLTLMGDRHTLAHATSTPGLAGYRVSLSIAGHQWLTGRRLELPMEENDAWVYAVWGNEWADYSYNLRAIFGGSTVGTIYYLLYLSEDLQPIPMPDAETLRGELIQPGVFEDE